MRTSVVWVALAVCFSPSASARPAQHPSPQNHDAHHREVSRRGADAMGFDQDRTAHRFLLYEDGGAIEVQARNAADGPNAEAVRRHLQEIAVRFKAGDFRQPAHTHAREVPGTADMTRLKARIDYRYEELAAGGRVNILTRDADALAAVHAFLRFQIEDHRTGDPGKVMVR